MDVQKHSTSREDDLLQELAEALQQLGDAGHALTEETAKKKYLEALDRFSRLVLDGKDPDVSPRQKESRVSLSSFRHSA